ncbi:MAG: hypothetical protein E3J87_08410 [Candidatus Cloacimonadota bacterium]|nr:MAG: hypothetical protein E3J87_08410 [Candidatus Cloacimonadota bacterium]
METLWEKVKKGFILVVEKTDELTKIGKLKLNIVGIHRKINQNFEELGGKIYALTKTGKRKKPVTDDANVQKLIKRIKQLEKDLAMEEKQLNNLIKKS